jgi:hypothetical protein
MWPADTALHRRRRSDGNTSYSHGRRDRDFCLLSDANLHINAHFIGSHVPGLKRDPTWVQGCRLSPCSSGATASTSGCLGPPRGTTRQPIVYASRHRLRR